VTYQGIVQDGIIVLPPDARLPEGTQVVVTVHETQPEPDSFLATALKLAKSRPHLPDDYALNHGH